MKYCMNCGKQSNDDALFCRDCGTRFEAAKIEPEEVIEADTPETEDVVEQVVPSEPAPVGIDEQAADTCEALEGEVQDDDTIQPSAPEQVEVAIEEEKPMPVMVMPVAEPVKAAVKPVSAPRDKRQTLGVAGYFWLTILFCIPVVGLVFLFIWGCGNPRNGSLKRFSLSCLILRLIAWIIIVAVAVVAIILFHDKFDGFVKVICQFISDTAALFGY